MFRPGQRVKRVRYYIPQCAEIGQTGSVVCSEGSESTRVKWDVPPKSARSDGTTSVYTSTLEPITDSEQKAREQVKKFIKDSLHAAEKTRYVINSQDALIGTDKRDLLVTK